MKGGNRMIQYAEHMKQVIEPFLEEHKTVFWLEREMGHKIYCARYHVEHAKGVVLISHGFGENEEKHKETIYRFLKKSYHVYFVEHCGHGNSYRLTEDLSLVHIDRYERYVEDFLVAAHFAKAENPRLPLYLFGHSMGGGIAIAVAAREPKLFKKMVLSAPMIRPYVDKGTWREAALLAKSMCLRGREREYVLGHKPYDGPRELERTSSMREAQNQYYQEERAQNPLLQTNGASYGWLYMAVRLNRYLQTEAIQRLQTPFLLFQAELDHKVSNREQVRFMINLQKAGRNIGKLVRVPGAKHEVFNASKHTREAFWKMVFRFLEK